MKSKHLSELIDSDFLPKSWEKKRLDEVAYINQKTSNLREYDWINYTDISSVGTRTVDKPSIIKVGDAPSRARRVLRKGDTVISTVRPNRKSFFYFAGEWESAIASTGFAVLSPINFEDSEYLHAILTSDLAVRFYENICEGGAYPAFNPSRLAEFVVPWPPKKTRIELGKTVMNFQLKIEINKGLSKTLEDIAQTIFKSWFIDFDPIKAKMAGEKPAGMADSTAALFPDSMEESELGLIPKGWKVLEITELGRVITGKTPSTNVAEYWGEDIPFVTIPDMHGTIVNTVTKRRLTVAGAESQKNQMLSRGSTMVSCIATPGLVVYATEPCQTNQQINSVTPKDSKISSWLYWHIRSLTSSVLLHSGVGTIFANLNKGDFGRIKSVVPTETLQLYTSQVFEPLLSQIESLSRENLLLADIRDNLLPRLISGELQIPEEMLAS